MLYDVYNIRTVCILEWTICNPYDFDLYKECKIKQSKPCPHCGLTQSEKISLLLHIYINLLIHCINCLFFNGISTSLC